MTRKRIATCAPRPWEANEKEPGDGQWRGTDAGGGGPAARPRPARVRHRLVTALPGAAAAVGGLAPEVSRGAPHQGRRRAGPTAGPFLRRQALADLRLHA